MSPAAFRAPWLARKILLDIRPEDHVRPLPRYFHYCHNQRTHLGLNKDSPEPREVQAVGEIERVAVANGLHHYYYRQAA